MASSSSSNPENKEFDGFSGILPAGKRRKVSDSSTLFDVFINNRGPDVKQTMAIQLYNSLENLRIRAFLDSEEKELGSSFPSLIEAAIRSASVHIAVFSKSYAESPWCLAELVLMLQSKAKIIPVYCHEVKPWELRDIEKGRYAEAFFQYEKKGRYLDKIEEWKKALQQVSYTAGYEFKYSDCNDCADIVSAVVKEVQRAKRLHVAEYPIGLDKLVKDFERQCELKKNNVVGVSGMVGVGKTTLAKELFNLKRSNYSGASFLCDVREAFVKSQLPSLQRQLLKDLFYKDVSFTSIEDGTCGIQESLRSNPHLSFLIVVDDIDDVEQLNALRIKDILKKSEDSLVIVTTRDKGVLITADIAVDYNVKGMDINDARELFCWYAFRQARTPCSSYEMLVEDFVGICGGLPLSLKLVGRQLHGMPQDFWRSKLIEVRRTLPEGVKTRLRISFDALDDEEKEVFMDIACFFEGKPKSVAERVWEGSGWDAQSRLQTLKEKCLVEEKLPENLSSITNEGVVLRMHNHLRDFGREMADELSPPHRLWRPQDLESLEMMSLENILAKPNTRCFLCIFDKSMGCQVTFFLAQSDSCVETSPSLVWLQLEGNSTELASIPSWIPLPKLQCLKLKCGQLKTLWGDRQQAPSELKELQISQTCLKEIPDLGTLDTLENVQLDSIGLPIRGLPLLESLNMSLCNLCLRSSILKGEQRLTRRGEDTVCESLVISNFKFNEEDWNDEELSSSVEGPMIGLEKLEISDEECISKILISEMQYPNLESVKLHDMKKLVEVDLRMVETLSYLLIKSCKNLGTVSGIPNLTNLVELEIADCGKLEFGYLCLSSMRCLETVKFDRNVILKCFLLNECQNLKRTKFCCKNLVELSIRDCPELVEIPAFMGPSCLERILIDRCGKLESLHLNGCHSLKSVSSSFEITWLRICDCPELEELPDLSTLCCLEKFEIRQCKKIQNIVLPVTLISLSVQSCRYLQRIAGTCDHMGLKELIISDCPDLEELPKLSGLRCLERLVIDSCENLQDIPGIEELHTRQNVCYSVITAMK